MSCPIASNSGRVKWKFPCLRTGLLFKLEHAPVIIDACVTLYNYFIVHEGVSEEFIFVDPDQTRTGTGRRAQGGAGGSTEHPSERRVEMEYLEDNGFILAAWGEPGSRADAARREVERVVHQMGPIGNPSILFEW